MLVFCDFLIELDLCFIVFLDIVVFVELGFNCVSLGI